jgi:hypothetical protein
MTNTSPTETDLRTLLSTDAHDVCDAVTLLARLGEERPRRRLSWWAPLTAAAAVAVVAVGVTVGLAHGRHHPATTDTPVGELASINWQLTSLNGSTKLGGGYLWIEPNGRFAQSLPGCGAQLQGQLSITDTHLGITQTHLGSIGESCPVLPKPQPTDPAYTAGVKALWSGSLSWTLRGAALSLTNTDGTTATYTRSPRSPARTRQWTYHGLGISLPANWPANATKCGTPLKNTVFFPGPVEQCLIRRPAGVTSIQFGPYNPGVDPFPSRPAERDGLMIDGIVAQQRETGPTKKPQIVEERIRSLNVSVIIISPSRLEADNLSSLLYLTHP